MIKFKQGYELVMIHPRYGEGKVEKIFIRNKVKWVHVRLAEYFWVETPKQEWKIKDYSQ